MNRRQLPILIAAVFVVAVVSLVVDLNTGDTTGPPYDDSLLNVVSFYTFLVSTVIFVGLCIVAWLYGCVTVSAQDPQGETTPRPAYLGSSRTS